jgi:hypothetical protein
MGRMRISIAGMVLMLWLCTVQAFAVDAVSVALKDGSVITGELVSLQNGVYTVSTDSLGTITIDESRIREIRYGYQASSRESGQTYEETPSGKQLQAIQRTLISDEQIMGLILSMQNDPEVQKILSDSEIMGAILSGDLNALQSNPKFLRLMDHPTVRKIQGKVEK